ncbi:MAG TPA: TolC family protein, partial [Vicinamibacterales bacterium]|nr:TolC family protein [Vicinamibacterales bacterium]
MTALFAAIGIAALLAQTPPTVAAAPQIANPLPPRVGVEGAPLPLTLEDAIRRALEHNTDVSLARIDTMVAAEDLRAARGAYDVRLFPTLSFQRAINASASALGGATQGRVEQRQLFGSAELSGLTPWAGGRFSIDFTSTRISTSNQFSRLNPQFPATFAMSYTQPLLRDRQIDNERRSILLAQQATDLTQAELTQTLMDQLMFVEQAYWELVYTARFLEVQGTALAQAEAQVASNERQAREGTLAPIDVVEAQTQVANFRQNLSLAQQSLTEAENRLKLLMLTGRESPEWNQPIVASDPVDRESPPWSLQEAVKVALTRRPELAALETVRASNEVERRFFQDQARPQVDLVGGVTLSGLAGGALSETDDTIPPFLIGDYATSLGNLFASRFPTAIVQLQMDLPLRNTTARANLARTELTGTQITRRRQQLEQSIEADVRNAIQAANSARDRLVDASQASRNAQEQYESERRRFDSGLSTVFLVLDRQSALVTAQARELRARADLNQALAMLDRAVGVTL